MGNSRGMAGNPRNKPSSVRTLTQQWWRQSDSAITRPYIVWLWGLNSRAFLIGQPLRRGRKRLDDEVQRAVWIFITCLEMQNNVLFHQHKRFNWKKVKRSNMCTDIDSHAPWFLSIVAFAVLMLPYLGFCYYNRAKMHAKLIREGLLSPYPPRFATHFNGYCA